MQTTPQQAASAVDTHQPDTEEPERGEVEVDDLVEDVSIDGMCGVY